ncbi:MAG: hypothetical protein V1808_05160 [Candidatus Daviesbacteria bacterium]
MRKFWPVLPTLLFGLIFIYVLFQIQPPLSLTTASFSHVAFFFIPLFFLITFILNILFQFLIRSLVLSFGLILILVFQSLGALNILSLTLVILATILIAKSFKKPQKGYQTKIPKVSKLAKQKSFDIRRLKR